jgi:hypothetical protein
MISNPIDIAMREVAETRYLVEAFITSSESFDHLRAKATLQELQTKVRSLGKLQARLSAQQSVQVEHKAGTVW